MALMSWRRNGSRSPPNACWTTAAASANTLLCQGASKASSPFRRGAGPSPIAGKVAASAESVRDTDALHFNPVKIKGNPYDFSFSGIKTAVLYYVRAHPEFAGEIEDRKKALQQGLRKAAELLPLCSPRTLSLIRNFQAAVVNDLVTRTLEAAAETGSRTVLVSGGVAANAELRERFTSKAASAGVSVYFPSRALSTDNAAMIAAAAYPHLLAGDLASHDLNADPNLRLA